MDTLQLAHGMMVAYAEKVEKNQINYAIGTWLTDAATAYAAIAAAEAAQEQAKQLAHIATHLGNIHQTLMTPDANGEPVFVADLLKRIAGALEAAHELATNPYR